MRKDCVLFKTIDIIGKKWSLIILLELYKGKDNKKRYSEIKKSINLITPKILSQRLKELEKFGLIKKIVYIKSSPIKTEYSLSKSGKEFIKIIKDIKSWTLNNNFKDKLCESTNCKSCDF